MSVTPVSFVASILHSESGGLQIVFSSMAFKIEIEDKTAIKGSDKIPPPVLLKAFLKFSSQPLIFLLDKCALFRFYEFRDSLPTAQNDKSKPFAESSG